jgi:glycerophosphoryl diester phosphodiesterase
MGRCGCGDICNCVIQDGYGVNLSGIGSANDPYVVNFEGSEVVGNGMAWDPSSHLLSTKLAAGGGLEFDAQGAMKTSAAPGGSGIGWTTIADLEAKAANQKIVIGHAGAGFMIKPECHLRSYRYGQHIGVDMLHVPVRALRDGTPCVYPDEMLGRVSGEPWNQATWNAKYVADQSPHDWSIIPSMSGLDNPYLRNQPDGNSEPTLEFGSNWGAAKWMPRSPSFGFLGYREQPQYGLTLLSDVFREVGGRTPLLLELRWPARVSEGGAFVKPTAPWVNAWYLKNILSMIQRFGLTNYVVVTTTEMTIPPEAGPDTNVLAAFANAGIRVGPHLTAAKLAAWPANAGTWPASWGWATFSNALTDAQIAPYKALTPNGNALRCILTQLNRHHEWSERVMTPGLHGATSADPPYAFAINAPVGHPLNGAGYRDTTSKWDYASVQHGLLAPNPANIGPYFRGIKQPGTNYFYMGPQMVPAVAGTTYYVLQGWGSPMNIPSDLYFDFSVTHDQFESPRSNSAWLALAFGRTDDRVFADWNPAPGASLPAQSGYTLMFTHRDTAADGVNPNIYLYGYENGAVVTMGTARTLTPVLAATAKRYRVGINFRGIRVSEVDGSGNLTTRIEVRTDLAKAHRGQYFHLGRLSQGAQSWYAYFSNFFYLEGGGATAGPQ